MLKQLLSDNRIFGAIICVIVFIGGGLLYLQFVQRQAARDTQRTQEIVKKQHNSQIGEPEPKTTPGGHYHADGTYHAQPHQPTQPMGSPQGAEKNERVNIAQGTVPEVNPSQHSAPLTPSSTTTFETDKLPILRKIRKTLPSDATVADVVAASDFVPSLDVVAAMTDEALMALYEDGAEKADAIEDEMERSWEAWHKVLFKLTSDENTLAENQRILQEHSDTVRPLRDKMDATRYEYYVHRVTARRALREVSRRTNASITKFPPGTIQLLLQREAERAAMEERQ